MTGVLPYFVVFLTIAFAFQLDFVFYIIYVCAGVYAWSRWYTPYVTRNVRIRRLFAARAFLRETVKVELVFENTGRLPLIWLQFADSIPNQLRADQSVRRVLSLKPRERKTISYEVWSRRRGYYRLGPLFLSLGDVFGFANQSGNVPPDYLTVYPEIIPMTRLRLPSRLPFGTIGSRQRLFEDPARPMGVRDYQAGDSLRRINWKASAHTSQLLVKTLEPAISLETAIILNLNRADYQRRERYDAPEWGITLAASLAAYLVQARQAVGLMTTGVDPLLFHAETKSELSFDEESGRLLLGSAGAGHETPAGDQSTYIATPIAPGRSRAHLMKVLESLARVETAETVDFNAWLPKACLNLSWGTTIPILTPNGDEVTCQSLHRLVRAGYNPILVIIAAGAKMAEIRERARRLGFPAFQIADPADLKQWQQVGQRG